MVGVTAGQDRDGRVSNLMRFVVAPGTREHPTDTWRYGEIDDLPPANNCGRNLPAHDSHAGTRPGRREILLLLGSDGASEGGSPESNAGSFEARSV